jgi:hypothetical protein
MGNSTSSSGGFSDGRNLTPRYMDVKKQLNATHDLNERLKKNGSKPANGLFAANNKAKQHGLINTATYNYNKEVNRKANQAKHKW